MSEDSPQFDLLYSDEFKAHRLGESLAQMQAKALAFLNQETGRSPIAV